jgi:hypothetical protein
VRANLVRTSRPGDCLHKRVWAKAFEDTTLSDRRFSGIIPPGAQLCLPLDHYRAMVSVAIGQEWEIYGHFSPGGISLDQRVIDLVHGVGLKLPIKRAVGVLRASQDKDATSIAIQAVDHPQPAIGRF